MANINNEKVANVIRLINAENVSFGSVVRNFIAVADGDEYASYMLDTICKEQNAKIVLSVNDIKKRIIIAYPYRREMIMLTKKEGLFVPMTKYSADVIKKAFYNAVGVTDTKKFVPATEEEIAENEAKVEAKKAEKKAAAEQKKQQEAEKTKKYERFAAFWQEMMTARNKEVAWEIVGKYKTSDADAVNEK